MKKVVLSVSNVADQFVLFVIMLRELLTQRQAIKNSFVSLGGGGGRGEERPVGGIWLPLLFPLSFLFAPATGPIFFVCYESCRQDELHTLDLCSCRFNQTKLVVT